MPKLTKRFVEAMQPDSEKKLIFWDSELKGFGVVVLPSGRKTYSVQYRNTQRIQRRLKIGVHGHVTTEEARIHAKNILSKVVQGADPALQSRPQTIKDKPSFEDLAQEYMICHAIKKRPKSQKEDQGMLNNTLLPVFHYQSVEDICVRDIQNFHIKLKNKPYQANRLLALLSKMFSLAVSWQWRLDNPVLGVERYQEEKRNPLA